MLQSLARIWREGTHEDCVARLGAGARRPDRGVGGGVALAQAPDATWLVGRWNGTIASKEHSGHVARVDVEMSPDGPCKCAIQSPTGALVRPENCAWEVVGDSVRLKYVVYAGKGRSLKNVELDLSRQGEELVGSGTRLARR